MKTGIDVSNHQGKIDWNLVKGKVDFVMIRAGYSTTADLMFESNATMCKNHGIPFGVYWASYALNDVDAIDEAKACLSTIKSFKPDLWVAFDFEEFSEKYAATKGVKLDGSKMRAIAEAFLQTIKAAGYKPMLYSNVDFINRAFDKLRGIYPLWLAQWGVSSPKFPCSIWQMSSTGKIAGINGKVDMDIMYDDVNTNFPSSVDTMFREKYMEIALDIIAGKYGNGAERKKLLKSKNIDVELAQALVNTMV